MRRKIRMSIIVLATLAALFSSTNLLIRNAQCKLSDPEVDVIPSEVTFYQQVVVQAKIDVLTC